MVAILIGDIFQSKAQTLVNTVNCVGVMGKGIALGFKKRFPGMYRDYVERCEAGKVKLGQPYLYKTLLTPWILNFPTKGHWRSVSKLTDITQGLNYLIAHYQEWGIDSLAVPPLGCGAGALEWRIIGPTLYRHLKKLDIPVELFAPFGTPHEELQPEFLNAAARTMFNKSASYNHHKVDPAWVALIEILKRIEKEPYHWQVGRTTFQKIAFVGTEKGLPTGLHYQKSSYGPFAKDLKRQIAKLINNGLIREERFGRMFAVKVGPTFNDARTAYKDYLNKWESQISKITDLFIRLNTHQAEIVATILFAAKLVTENKPTLTSENEILSYVMQWKKLHRPPLDETEIACAIRNLGILGWLNVKSSKDLPVDDEILV